MPPRSENKHIFLQVWQLGRPFPAPPQSQGLKACFLMTEAQYFQQPGEKNTPWLFYKQLLTLGLLNKHSLCVCSCLCTHIPSSPGELRLFPHLQYKLCCSLQSRVHARTRRVGWKDPCLVAADVFNSWRKVLIQSTNNRIQQQDAQLTKHSTSGKQGPAHMSITLVLTCF